MSDQLTLPGMPELPAPAPLARKSADRARTARQRAGLTYGVHPLTYALDGMLKVHPTAAADGRTCGNCAFREVVNLGTQSNYPKCLADRGPCSPHMAGPNAPRVSRGSGTDVRRWWPGCRDHEFGDNALSPDAARSGPATAYAE